MKESIYLETTIISYILPDLIGNIVIAGHQQITKDFVDKSALRYDIIRFQN